MAESILSYFPGFDAFKLPPPSSDPDVVLNLNREEVQDDINKSFLRGVDEFKSALKSKLTPKHSFNEGEFVTGEGIWRNNIGVSLFWVEKRPKGQPIESFVGNNKYLIVQLKL